MSDDTAQSPPPKPKHSFDQRKKRKETIRRVIWIGLAFDIFLIDQISKWWITEIIFRPKITGQDGFNLLDWYLNTPTILSYIQIEITSFFNLVMAWNTGVSFSLFSGYGVYMPYILIAVASGITVIFARWLWRAESHLHGIACALVIGGALGNIIDRARFGAVIDFLDVHAYGYHWPAFNVADMAVVSGVFLLIITSLFFDIKRHARYRKRSKNKQKTRY